MSEWKGTWKPDGTGGWHTKSDIVEQYNSARLTPAPTQMLKDAIDEVVRLRAENETLRRDVRTAVMGDSAELADMKRENEKLRRAMHDIYEVYAGSEGGLYENSIYTLDLVKEMAAIAAEHKK